MATEQLKQEQSPDWEDAAPCQPGFNLGGSPTSLPQREAAATAAEERKAEAVREAVTRRVNVKVELLDQGSLKALWGVPLVLLPLPGSPGFPSGFSKTSLELLPTSLRRALL